MVAGRKKATRAKADAAAYAPVPRPAEPRLDDEEVDVGDDGDPAEPDDHRPEVVQEWTQRRSRGSCSALELPMDQTTGDEGGHDATGDSGEHRAGKPVASSRHQREQRQSQREREDIHGGADSTRTARVPAERRLLSAGRSRRTARSWRERPRLSTGC